MPTELNPTQITVRKKMPVGFRFRSKKRILEEHRKLSDDEKIQFIRTKFFDHKKASQIAREIARNLRLEDNKIRFELISAGFEKELMLEDYIKSFRESSKEPNEKIRAEKINNLLLNISYLIKTKKEIGLYILNDFLKNHPSYLNYFVKNNIDALIELNYTKYLAIGFPIELVDYNKNYLSVAISASGTRAFINADKLNNNHKYLDLIAKYNEDEYPVGINHLINDGFFKELIEAGYENKLIDLFGINKVSALKKTYKIF